MVHGEHFACSGQDGKQEIVPRRCYSALFGPGPYLIEGVMDFDREEGEPLLRAEKIDAFNAG